MVNGCHVDQVFQETGLYSYYATNEASLEIEEKSDHPVRFESGGPTTYLWTYLSVGGYLDYPWNGDKGYEDLVDSQFTAVQNATVLPPAMWVLAVLAGTSGGDSPSRVNMLMPDDWEYM